MGFKGSIKSIKFLCYLKELCVHCGIHTTLIYSSTLAVRKPISPGDSGLTEVPPLEIVGLFHGIVEF